MWERESNNEEKHYIVNHTTFIPIQLVLWWNTPTTENREHTKTGLLVHAGWVLCARSYGRTARPQEEIDAPCAGANLAGVKLCILGVHTHTRAHCACLPTFTMTKQKPGNAFLPCDITQTRQKYAHSWLVLWLWIRKGGIFWQILLFQGRLEIRKREELCWEPVLLICLAWRWSSPEQAWLPAFQPKSTTKVAFLRRTGAYAQIPTDTSENTNAQHTLTLIQLHTQVYTLTWSAQVWLILIGATAVSFGAGCTLVSIWIFPKLFFLLISTFWKGQRGHLMITLKYTVGPNLK